MKKIRLILCIIAILFSTQANAGEFTSQGEVGVGYSNNVYLSDGNERPDGFWKISSTNTWQQDVNRPQLRLSYRDYFKENANDLFSWRVGNRWQPPQVRGWTAIAGVFGSHYTQTSPGMTDESFNNIGVDGRAETFQRLTPSIELTWGPGTGIRNYIDQSLRTDFSMYVNATLDFDSLAELNFATFGETGMIFSSESSFSRLYLELGGNADYDVSRAWKGTSELSVRGTYFTNRTIDTQTITTRSRGKFVRAGTVARQETYQTVNLSSAMMRDLSPNWKSGFELNINSQSSASALQDYSEIGLFVKLIGTL